ncbi:ABC transporter permease [Facklamia miroungae]|uniref:ABC-type Na+ efflux pump, permease component n=1 Tax=Facklamia miroungae TaxID=120956 RepID=A0A1G7RS19_9LACT|nr:ABC transporter permease [Facklamia miroungae]NKZ29304.1 ABC transporter permease [Facklamia miroungae]SDG13414.1 ABC-type Na+ efflux pump, permease component [Facklamia miroungae]
MKQYFKLTTFHIKRIMQDPKSLLLVILPVALSFMMGMIFSSDNSHQQGRHAYLSQSTYFNRELYPLLSQSNQGEILEDREQAEERLDQGAVDVIYSIHDNFEENGQITALSLNGEIYNQYVEEEVMSLWRNNKIQASYQVYGIVSLQEKAPEITIDQQKDFLPVGMMLSLFMIFYMMYINASMFAGDLLDMRSNYVLKRSIVSRSTGKAILGSVLSAYGLIFLVLNVLALLIVMLVNQLPLQFFGLSVAYFMANVAFVIGYILLIVRVFKTKEMLSIVSIVIAIMFVLMPQVLKNTHFEPISMLSPFYWTMEGLDYANFFPQGLIILLMAIVLFTAGSFKIEDLAKA